MVVIRGTATFLTWLKSLRDIRARVRIQVGIDRMSLGNAGDINQVGDGVSEMRIDYGPGYRVDLARRGAEVIIFLNGGDNSSRSADMAGAKMLAKEIRDDD